MLPQEDARSTRAPSLLQRNQPPLIVAWKYLGIAEVTGGRGQAPTNAGGSGVFQWLQRGFYPWCTAFEPQPPLLPTTPEFRGRNSHAFTALGREILQTFTKQKEKFGLTRTRVAKLRMSGEKENSVSSCAPPLFGHMENQSECGQSRKTLFFFSAPPTVECPFYR